MKISITYRLFLSILSATCLALLAMFLIMQWSINKGFLEYIRDLDQERLPHVAQALGKEYGRQGSWAFLNDDPEFVMAQLFGRPLGRHPGGLEARDFPPAPPLHPSPRAPHRGPPVIVLDATRTPVFGKIPDGNKVNFAPVVYDGQTVGYIGLLTPPPRLLTPRQLDFLARQKSALIFGAVGMVLIVVLFSLPLSRRLVRPIRAMASATRDIAAGNYVVRIPLSSSDELGQLARSFNLMALTLEKNEKARRQWIADISHELRTPVGVLLGEIEALLDGIRPTTRDAIQSLHSETLRLRHLVDDLYQLALSDLGALTYRKENLNLGEVIMECAEGFQAELAGKGIELIIDKEARGVIVFGDRERLHQLFANLFDNSSKYTNAGGTLRVWLRCDDARAFVDFEDSSPGVPESEIDKLFDRLYRVEPSRSRASGGAGLGLSICKNIAEAHEGAIRAGVSPLGGLRVTVWFPSAVDAL